AVEMAVLLPGGLRRIGFDMGLDRLDDRGCLRADDALAEHLRPTLPGHVLRRINALFFLERLVEVAVGAFERAHECALVGRAFPLLVLLLHFEGVGLIMADARGLDNACHPCSSSSRLRPWSRPHGHKGLLPPEQIITPPAAGG